MQLTAGFFAISAAICAAHAAPAAAQPLPRSPGESPPATWGGPAPPPRAADDLLPLEGLDPGDKRPRQDYDGRPDEVTAGEVALWIPRILFFPAYVVTEYLIRVPIGALLISAERYGIVSDLLKP